MTENARLELAEELREYTAMKYAGNCKCGKCQLVPRALVERIYHTLNGTSLSPPPEPTLRPSGEGEVLPPGCNYPICDQPGHPACKGNCDQIAVRTAPQAAPEPTREEIAKIVDDVCVLAAKPAADSDYERAMHDVGTEIMRRLALTKPRSEARDGDDAAGTVG